MSVLHQPIVLKLNAQWTPIGVCTPEEAFVRMSRPVKADGSKQPYSSLHIEYPKLPNGKIDFSSPCTTIPVGWKDWISLPVRSFDKHIGTALKKIRVPTVIIANNYSYVPIKFPKFTKHSVWLRDNFTCQISGKKVTKKTGNIDHWVPVSAGGQNTFENCYIIQRKLNQLKGDMSMEAFCKKYGYPMPAKPKAPISGLKKIQNVYEIPDWDIFLED